METIHIPDTYVRHQGPTSLQRIFDNPPEGLPPTCLVCDEAITGACTLVPIGCADPDDQQKMRGGGWVSAKALVVHASCAGLG